MSLTRYRWLFQVLIDILKLLVLSREERDRRKAKVEDELGEDSELDL